MAQNNAANHVVTQYNVITGGATNVLNNVAPSATSGVAVISQGSSAQPVFGTVVVAGGGTGATSLTGVLIGNGTSAVTASTITQYGTVVAGASNAVSSIAPSATSGIPYISQGSSANPVFGTAVVGGGGTGNTTFTAYSVICAGTTATGAFQNVSGVGTSGQVLTSAGASALPTWAASSGVGTLVLVSSQTASNTATLAWTGMTASAVYLLVFHDVVPVTNGQNLQLVMSNDNGSTYKNSNYHGGVSYQNVEAAATLTTGVGTSAWLISPPLLNSQPAGNGFLWIYNVNEGNYPGIVGSSQCSSTTTNSFYGMTNGNNTSNTGLNAIRLQHGSGNISAGVFSLYYLVT